MNEYRFENLTAYLDASLEKLHIPGLDLKVLHHGKEVYRHMAGVADLETQKPLSEQTKYFLYSVTKVITCATALKAMEEGYFLAGENVSAYLPEFADVKVNENGTLVSPKRPLRIRDLFCMGSGLNYDLHSPAIEKVLSETNGKAPTREVVRAIAKSDLEFHPGERFRYGLSHDVLAGLVEVATGKRFSDYTKEKIFEPLEMTDTCFYHGNATSDFATLYALNDGKIEKTEQKNDYIVGTEYDSGGAGVASTVNDLAKFGCMMGAFGIGPHGVRILNRSSIELMRKNLLPIGSQALTDFQNWGCNNGEFGYGFGVRTNIGVGLGANYSSLGTFGWGGAAGALLDIDPEREIVIAYAQHILHHDEAFHHPRIRNLVTLALGY